MSPNMRSSRLRPACDPPLKAGFVFLGLDSPQSDLAIRLPRRATVKRSVAECGSSAPLPWPPTTPRRCYRVPSVAVRFQVCDAPFPFDQEGLDDINAAGLVRQIGNLSPCFERLVRDLTVQRTDKVP